MANTSLVTAVVNSLNTTLTITDTTTFTSPLRTAVGVYVKAFKVDFRGSETPLTTTPNNSNANTDSAWTVSYGLDGHYRIKYISVPDYLIGATYAINQAVFEPTTKLFYKSKSNSNLGNAVVNTTFWLEVSDPSTIVDLVGTATASSNVDVLNTNYLFFGLLRAKRDQAAIDASIEYDMDAQRDKDVDAFQLLDVFTEGCVAASSLGQYLKGERITRRGEAL